MIRALIAEEDAAVRARLQRAVTAAADSAGEECVIAETEDGLTTFRKAKRLQPDLVLISSSLPLGGRVQIVLALQLYAARARIVVLAGRDERTENLLLFTQAGVLGVLPKHQRDDMLQTAIGRAMRGERP
jgi:DNA-binding NarL/FixJ family response regulator